MYTADKAFLICLCVMTFIVSAIIVFLIIRYLKIRFLNDNNDQEYDDFLLFDANDENPQDDCIQCYSALLRDHPYKPLLFLPESESTPNVIINKLYDPKFNPVLLLHSITNKWGTKMVNIEGDVIDNIDKLKVYVNTIIDSFTGYDQVLEVVFKQGRRFTFQKPSKASLPMFS
jgi:hypothetical protein